MGSHTILPGAGTNKVATHPASLSASVLLPTLNADITSLPFTLATDLATGTDMTPL